jgi:hypothetical protein
MYRIVFFTGGCSARLCPGQWLIHGRGVHAWPHDGLRTGRLRGPFCRVLRQAESKVYEFEAGDGRPDLERPRCLEEQPAYAGVERGDNGENRQPTCAFLGDCRHGFDVESKCLADRELKALRIVAEGHGIASVRIQRYAE